MVDYTIIVLSLNEEMHLPKLFESIKGLNAPTFVLDSGSSDSTLEICRRYKVPTAFHTFENHPKQWHAALNTFPIKTPWVIGLDSDQVVTPELFQLLKAFKDEDFADVNGIYFNRKFIFKGRWVKYGGFYPKYLLKMFRTGVGYSDLSENMDHRFIVPGRTVIWKRGHIIEENYKENRISFWINKHNRYSDLVAEEEIERAKDLRSQTLQRRLFGSPDERIAWLKNIWWKLPLGVRPFLYIFFRLFVRLGIFDGRTGVLFHFLQAFWFRLIVDVKIIERKTQNEE
jgi:glycosyltransferase involved in cell wall biosynthesis